MTAKPGYGLKDPEELTSFFETRFGKLRTFESAYVVRAAYDKLGLDRRSNTVCLCHICGPVQVLAESMGFDSPAFSALMCSPSKHAAYYAQFPVPRTLGEAFSREES